LEDRQQNLADVGLKVFHLCAEGSLRVRKTCCRVDKVALAESALSQHLSVSCKRLDGRGNRVLFSFDKSFGQGALLDRGRVKEDAIATNRLGLASQGCPESKDGLFRCRVLERCKVAGKAD
jgi:hypothetical protein